MEDEVWLDSPIHKNNFSNKFWEENPAILDSLLISFDGSIMAVDRGCVENHYSNQEVDMMKLGYKPFPENMKVETSDDFFKMISLYVTL
jgi:hypothetical protein